MRKFTILLGIITLALGAGVAYVMLADFPAPSRDTTQTIPNVTIQQ